MTGSPIPHPKVFSAFASNVPSDIVSGQKRVFDHLGIDLRQRDMGDMTHGRWLDHIVETEAEDIFVFADIDAFPLTRSAFERVCLTAAKGGLSGLAQVANHLDRTHIYASPVFMAFSRETYERLGTPSLNVAENLDAAQSLTKAAETQGVDLDFAFPATCVKAKWPMADRCIYGIGTFYGANEFFHLFQARYAGHVDLFNAVVDDVINDRHLDFRRYLNALGVPDDIPVSRRGRLRTLFRRFSAKTKS